MEIPRNDPTTPKLVWARAPDEQTRYVRLSVDEKTLTTLFESRRLASLGEYAGLIFGLGVLNHPAVIYQGLKRPFLGPGVDDTIDAYVSRPHLSYTYRPEKILTNAELRTLPAPINSVFIAFVSLAIGVVEEARIASRPAGPEIDGAVRYWEWTMASESDPNIPRDADSRYGREVWRRP
jgi:hypothetical protein